MEATTPPGEASPRQEKQRHLLALYEQRVAQGSQRLASSVAAVAEAQNSINHLGETEAAQLLDAVAWQVQRIGTLRLELSLWQPQQTPEPEDQTEATPEFSVEAVRQLLTQQEAEAREQNRLVALAWDTLTVSRRELLRQMESVGPEPQGGQAHYRAQHMAAVSEHERLLSARKRQLWTLRDQQCLARQALLEQLEDWSLDLETCLQQLDPAGDELVADSVDVLEEDLVRIASAQVSLYSLNDRQRDELHNRDRKLQSLRQELLDFQLYQDELTMRVEALRGT